MPQRSHFGIIHLIFAKLNINGLITSPVAMFTRPLGCWSGSSRSMHTASLSRRAERYIPSALIRDLPSCLCVACMFTASGSRITSMPLVSDKQSVAVGPSLDALRVCCWPYYTICNIIFGNTFFRIIITQNIKLYALIKYTTEWLIMDSYHIYYHYQYVIIAIIIPVPCPFFIQMFSVPILLHMLFHSPARRWIVSSPVMKASRTESGRCLIMRKYASP